jgi:hypothetical protein
LHSGALTVATCVWQLTEGQIAQLLSGAEMAAREEAALRSWLKDPQVTHRSSVDISYRHKLLMLAAMTTWDCCILCRGMQLINVSIV